MYACMVMIVKLMMMIDDCLIVYACMNDDCLIDDDFVCAINLQKVVTFPQQSKSGIENLSSLI